MFGYKMFLGGDAYISDFKVNDDTLNSYQVNSQIGVDSAGNFVIVWSDVRGNPGSSYPPKVYCQRYNKFGAPLGNNFGIGQDTASIPYISVLHDGRFIVTWLRFFFINSIQRYEIYFQRFSNNGNMIAPPSKLIDSTFIVSINIFAGLNISSDTIGNFIISWCNKPDYNSNPLIHFQRFDSSGNKIDSVKIVNEANGYPQYPSIASNKDGSFVIAWQDSRYTTQTKYDIYIQRYNPLGLKIGSNIKVNDNPDSTTDQVGAKVSTDGKGNITVCWIDDRNSLTGIYYQLYDSLGMPVGINRAAISSSFGSLGGPVLSMRSDKKFFIGWLQFSGREQYYGKRFDASGNAIGNAFMVPSISQPPTEQRPDDVFLLGDRLYSTWTDNLNVGVNTDIYCNVRGFQNPDTVIGINSVSNIAGKFNLYPAYPNPFNPSTNIKYQISKSDYISLLVYDITGKLVKTLFEGQKEKGEYTIKWNAENFSSGIYFIKMKAESGYNSVQKLVLLK